MGEYEIVAGTTPLCVAQANNVVAANPGDGL